MLKKLKLQITLISLLGVFAFFPLSVFGQEVGANKFSLGLSLVNFDTGLSPGINAKYYFMPNQSFAATLGPVEGGSFVNLAYMYDFYQTGQKPLVKFYGGAGFVSTTVYVDTVFFGKGTASATGLWIPVGASFNFNNAEIFAEVDFVAYTGSNSSSDVLFSIGGRYYFL